LAIALTGCPPVGPDTCNDGVNMTNPRLVNGLEQAGGRYQVRITWDAGTGRGAELPDEYFANVYLGGSSGAPVEQTELIASVAQTGPRELTVVFQQAVDADYLREHASISFRLFFPDRRGFIECRHPGSADRYVLDVLLTLDGSGVLQAAQLTEDVMLGPI
jgi:hypothetical protein